MNTSATAVQKELTIEGAKKLAKQAQVTVLRSDNTEAVNSLDDPASISPAESTVEVKGKKIALSAAAYSFTIVRVKMQ